MVGVRALVAIVMLNACCTRLTFLYRSLRFVIIFPSQSVEVKVSLHNLLIIHKLVHRDKLLFSVDHSLRAVLELSWRLCTFFLLIFLFVSLRRSFLNMIFEFLRFLKSLSLHDLLYLTSLNTLRESGLSIDRV
jgi:hypothetical protein